MSAGIPHHTQPCGDRHRPVDARTGRRRWNKCQRCRNDGRNAAIDMHGHVANETNIADTSNRTAEYSSCAIDVYNRSSTSEGRSLSLISIGRTYHRVDYRVQSLVRTSASTTANNSASDCADEPNTGSGDRSASPPMCAGVRVVVLARALVEKMPIGSGDTSHAPSILQ